MAKTVDVGPGEIPMQVVDPADPACFQSRDPEQASNVDDPTRSRVVGSGHLDANRHAHRT